MTFQFTSYRYISSDRSISISNTPSSVMLLDDSQIKFLLQKIRPCNIQKLTSISISLKPAHVTVDFHIFFEKACPSNKILCFNHRCAEEFPPFFIEIGLHRQVWIQMSVLLICDCPSALFQFRFTTALWASSDRKCSSRLPPLHSACETTNRRGVWLNLPSINSCKKIKLVFKFFLRTSFNWLQFPRHQQ